MKNAQQTDIFSLFNIEDEVAIKKKREEEERKKKLEEYKKKNAESTPEHLSSTKKKQEVKKEEPFEVNHETFIFHLGQQIPIQDYFSTEEIEQGLPSKKKDSEDVEFKKIDGNEVRKRLEKDYPDLLPAYTDMVYIKQKNMIMPVPKAKKKGLSIDCINIESSSSLQEGSFPSERVPFSLLREFIAISKHFEHFPSEVHADIYYDRATKEFFMDIPQQVAHTYWVERTEEPMVTAMKLMDRQFMKVGEIHSHHRMKPVPSSLDDESERQGGVFYAIVGKVESFFPSITVRVFDPSSEQHINLSPFLIFEDPFKDVPTEYDLTVVEVDNHV
ncbi:hypothetical protein ACFSCX_06740 [Bacillus salitolerans]|uniref:JAB domain-containing protein n=1 Tax=Bacillus salitolerans TaxID=1437434 RepID=A0ABW4LME9_9BACI